MKQVNCLLTFLFLFSLICPSWQVKAQSSGKNLNEEPVVIQNYVGNGDVSNTSQTPAPQNKKLINQVRELSKQLNEARESGNIQLTKELENQINTLVGSKPVTPGFGPQAIPLTESIIQRDGDDPRTINKITPGYIWATATATQNTDGRIWVATTHFAAGLTDTLRIFYSDDGGLTWAYLTGFTYAANEVDFRTDDIDIEVLNNGTDWYIYISGTITYISEAWSFVARYKADGSEFFYSYLPKNSGTNQYWTRIVSDYPQWSTNAYVYIVATLDSALDASTMNIWTRAYIIQDPYAASPTILNRNNNGNAYWWYSPSAPIYASARTDVAYYDSLTAGDRIVTTTIFANSTVDINAYMTYSNNYMATLPYLWNSLSLTYKSSSPIMSFSGGSDQLSGCITTVWNWNDSPDKDPRYIVTNDGGATWNQGYIEATTDTTVKADVIGLRGIDGHFKFSWINLDAPNPEFLYRTGYLNGSFVLTDPVAMYGGGIFPSENFGGRAGYKLMGADSCFAVFEGPLGTNAYSVSGCDDPVSVENNNVLPANYSISQNYPNPFNPKTTIKYSIPSLAFVKIKVFNLLGQEIAELVNKELQTGNYEVIFDASNLPSGIYFYRIEAGNFVQTKKMILMK